MVAKWPPEKINSLIPGICEYGKRHFADVIKVSN